MKWKVRNGNEKLQQVNMFETHTYTRTLSSKGMFSFCALWVWEKKA